MRGGRDDDDDDDGGGGMELTGHGTSRKPHLHTLSKTSFSRSPCGIASAACRSVPHVDGGVAAAPG